jgi:hypothetical protein
MPKAKKKSTDPVQQALRDHKAEWKDSQKDFIAQVQGLKNGLNGRGDTRFGIPPSNIKDPLPGEVASLLGSLTSQFQTLVGGAGSIIAEQNAYAQNRRKKQEKKQEEKKQQLKPVAPTAQNPNQPEQAEKPAAAPNSPVDSFLSNVASADPNLMEIHGSNRLSRGLQYAGGWFSRKEETKKRISLLSSAADVYKDFLDLENTILSSDMESIPQAIMEFHATYKNLLFFKSSLMAKDPSNTTDSPQEGNAAPPTEGAPQAGAGPGPNRKPMPDTERLQELMRTRRPAAAKSRLPPQEQLEKVLMGIRHDMQIIFQSSLPFKTEAKNINKLISEFAKAQAAQDHDLAYDLHNQIDRENTALKLAVSSMIDKEPNADRQAQLRQMINKENQVQADWEPSNIIKISHVSFTRFLKRKLLEQKTWNKTVHPRLRVAKSIDEAKKTLQTMMDSLETKTINKEELLKGLGSLLTLCQTIQEDLSSLNLMYETHRYKERKKNKIKNKPNTVDPLLDTLYQNELRRSIKQKMF